MWILNFLVQYSVVILKFTVGIFEYIVLDFSIILELGYLNSMLYFLYSHVLSVLITILAIIDGLKCFALYVQVNCSSRQGYFRGFFAVSL